MRRSARRPGGGAEGWGCAAVVRLHANRATAERLRRTPELAALNVLGDDGVHDRPRAAVLALGERSQRALGDPLASASRGR